MALLDIWLWVIFLVAGILMVIIALAIGIKTNYYLASIGFAFIFGAFATWPLHSWVWTAVGTGILCAVCILCLVCITFVRRYIGERSKLSNSREKIAVLIGSHGIVTQNIVKSHYGLVDVGDKQWRAGATQHIKKGEEVIVTHILGTTLIVKRIEGNE